MFRDFELPFVPTVVVGFVLLICMTGLIASNRPLHSHNEQIESSGAFWQDNEVLVIPAGEIDANTLFASKWIAVHRGAKQLRIQTAGGDLIATHSLP
jgi:hypothetical protein